MKFFNWHFNWLYDGNDYGIVIGIAGGRVLLSYWEHPSYKWLYSLRIMLLICRIEILWMTK